MATLPKISPEIIQAYQKEIAQTSSEATAKRKTISLNRFFDWAQGAGHLSENPLANQPGVLPQPTNQVVRVKKNIGTRTFAVIGMTTGLMILLFLLVFKLKLPIPFTINFAQEANLQTVQNQNLVGQNLASQSASLSAVSAVNGAWNLFAKLKLVDSSGAPLVGSETLNFKLYNSEKDGEPVYSSQPQTITTDTDGSALISLDDVPTDLFFKNNQLFLEAQTGSSSAKVRIPVSTASTPSNIGGFFPSDPNIGATNETVPVINSEGSLLLASQSPAIKAKKGNLLIEGQAVTLKTADGGNGNIEINPDGSGYAHFLFEGSKGNFLNAQGPNLTSGSLYYGMVPNNAIGYDLIRLQSGSPKMTTKFSVDAKGNTFAAGNLNVAGNIATSGVDRLTSGGALTSITGYSQNSGNFVINQNPGDTASITKNGTALSDVLNLTLNENYIPGSHYSSLVLNRLGGDDNARALLVNSGNAQFNGQLQLGRFTTNPGVAIGPGSLIYNSTDNLLYFWNGTSWTSTSGAASAFSAITSGTNNSATMVVGTGASLSYSGTGTINATTLNSIADTSFLRSDTSDNYTSGTLTTDAGTTLDINGDLTVSDANVVFDATNTTFTTTGDLNLNLGGGHLVFANNQTFNVGGNGSSVAYNVIGDSTAGAGASMNSDNDLYVQGDLQVGGSINGLSITPGGFTTGSVTFIGSSGNLSEDNSNFFWDNTNKRIGIGDNTPLATLTVGAGDLFQVAGATGNITTAGDIAVNGGDITSSGGTTTIGNALTVTGNTTLGDAITDNITFTGRVAQDSDLIPITTTGTNDLGSTLLPWDNLYAVAIAGTTITQNGFGVCDSSGANCPAGAGFWSQTLGALYPTNNTVDLLIGASSTASAKFAFINVNSGVPTASIAGDIANVATYLTGDGNLSTTNAQGLTLGSATTGNVVINSRGSAALTANGANLTTTGTFTLPNSITLSGVTNYLQSSAGFSVGGGTTYYFDGSGNINANDGTFAGNVNFNGNTTIGNAITDNITFTGRVAQDSDLIPIGTTGTNDLGSASLPWDNIYGVTIAGTTITQNGNAVCDSSGANCPAGAGFWSMSNGALYPTNNTVDLLIGASATTSAKFAFINVNSGVPTASISGTTANVSTFVDGNGNVSTTNRANLTLGNSSTYDTTGNTLINPNGTGFVGIGTTSPLTTLQVTGANQAVASHGNIFVSSNDTAAADKGGQITLGGNITGGQNDFAAIAGRKTSGGIAAGNGSGYLQFSVNDAVGLNFAGSLSEKMRLDSLGDLGVGTTGADARIDSAANSEQLRLTWTDGSIYTSFTTDVSGNLTIAPTGGNVALTSDLAVNGATSADITSSTTTATVFNSTVTTLSMGGAATTFNIGQAGSGASSILLAGGSADTGCTIDGSNGNLTCSGDIAINGGDLTSTATTFNLLAGATTLNIGPTGSGASSILFSGGSGDTGCTLDGSTGNLTCSGSFLTTATTGTQGWWQRNLGVLSPANITDDLTIGGIATSSAKFQVASGTGNITTSGDLALNGGDLTSTATTLNFDVGNTGTLNFRDGTNVLAAISDQGTTGRLAISDSLQVGGTSTVAYSRFGTATTTHPGNLTAPEDVLTNGDLELNGVLYLDGGTIADVGGVATIIFPSDPSAVDSPNVLDDGVWFVNNTVNAGMASLMVNQGKGGDIISASQSGVTKWTLANETAAANLSSLYSNTITTGNVFSATASAITSGSIIKLGEAGPQNFTGNGIAMDFDNTGGGSFTGNFLSFQNAGSTKFIVDYNGQVQVGNIASAPTAIGGGSIYYNTTDNQLYYNNTKAWVSLDPTKGGKNELHALYRSLADTYTTSQAGNQYSQFESIARGIAFDNFADTLKTDVANTTSSGPTQFQDPKSPTPVSGAYRTGLFGGQTYNSSTTDSAGTANYLGSNTVNDIYYYDRTRDSSPAVQVELGIDPNWYNGVTLSVATTSAQLSQNGTVAQKNPNLTTTYNGSLIKATGTDSTPHTIFITIKSPTTFDWTDYTGESATAVTMTPGTAQSLGGTGISINFTQANYNVGDVFRIASWYQEPASTTRGSKQQFPERSNIIVENTDVDIIDADTQKLWMHFDQGSNFAIGGTTQTLTSGTALNGKVYVSNSSTGLYNLNFVGDDSTNNQSDGLHLKTPNGLANRNSSGSSTLSNPSLSIVTSVANDVAAAVIPNQPTEQITVSGWGYIVNTATQTINENVSLPYKFNNTPTVTISYIGGTGSTVPTKQSDCSTTSGLINATATLVTTSSFQANLNVTSNTNFTAGNYNCYSWTATGVVSPHQYVAVATGSASADGGTTIINETDGTSVNVEIGSQIGATYWQGKVALTNKGDMYLGINNATSLFDVLDVYYGIAGITSSETTIAQYRNGGYLQNLQTSGWSTNGPVISGTASTNIPFYSLHVTEGTSTADPGSNTIYIGTSIGTSVLQEKQGHANAADGSIEQGGSVKYYNKSYVTEEMIGDVKGMWPMTESSGTLTDASVKANKLAAKGTTTYSVSAVRGTGITPNGTTGYFCSDANNDGTCDSDTDYDFGTGSFSISAWFKTSSSSAQQILERYISTSQTSQAGFRLEVLASGAVQFDIDDDTTYNPDDAATTTATYNNGQWHHAVAVKDGTSGIYLYVDGVLSASKVGLTATGSLTGSSNILSVGTQCATANCATGIHFFSGSLDELMITATALTPGQIKNMYDIGYRALQSHGTGLGGSTADTNQQIGGTSNTIGITTPDLNNQYMYVGSNDSSGPGALSKIQLNSDTNIKTYDVAATGNTPTGGTNIVDDDVNSLGVGYNLEVVGSAASGVKSMGVDNNSTATSGIFYSKTQTLPEAVTSVYLWTNTYTDASDGGSTLTVAASNDGGSNYATCSNTNNDTNQDPQENEYVCRFAASGSSLKVKLTFARTSTKQNNYITQYGVGWTASGADFAENYLTDEGDLGIASLVKIKNGGVNTLVGKTSNKYDDGMIGVVSTRPGMTLGPNDGTTPGYSSQTQAGTIPVPIALSGRVPVKVSTESGTIKKGDYLTSSSTPGVAMKAIKAGKVIGQALEDWDPSVTPDTDRVLVFINPGYFAGTLTADGDINVDFDQKAKDEQDMALLKQIFGIFDTIDAAVATNSGTIKSTSDFMKGLTQNVNIDMLQATLVKTKGIQTEIAKVGQFYADNIKSGVIETQNFVSENLIAKNIKTGVISPLADSTDITIKLGSEATPSGKLAIQDISGNEVAAIDSAGNATFSGEVHADKIFANQIIGGVYSSSDSAELEKIQNLLTQSQTDQSLLAELKNSVVSLTATNSANLAQVNTDDLYVTNQAAINSLSVSSNFAVGSDFVISQALGINGPETTLNTLSEPLKLQSLALAPVEIMAGLIKIDTHGNVNIAGDLYVAGKIESNSLNIVASDENGTKDITASIDASGSATFNSLSTQNFVIAASDATESGTISNGEINTNSSIGKAIIPAGVDQITIRSPKVNDYTLVYVTPTSRTQNYVLYVKEKGTGYFKVGFDRALDTDVSFNWWVVQVQN